MDIKSINDTRYLKFLFITYFFLLVGCNSRPTDVLVPPENFYQASEKVYRSGQPTRGEMKWLEVQGIKTIINLREYHSDSDDVKGTQLETFHVKMNAGRINDKDVIEVLRKINSTSDPVLVHCWHGSDRTGTVIAMYRLIFENWTKEQAIAELRKKEYGYHELFFPNIIQYLEEVDISAIKQQVFNQQVADK
ncbi:fused DSP-PTPase phosphatase/NAD kinase-like protein [Proteus terrae]|uniref:fused DSP-PTPase phosphatase/NAD kinase-like protein n=1 Tax=Proteus terrae TaxID=1574161 RepID=UPI00132026C7|nr:dual specificity protein phosphatase family protein [Proteus terrae]QHD96194.1 protein tyrosine phosphatase [Proteus terrae subsp. cibarius]QJW51628.1 protein tyrosine phosphatase [Proteus terrae subsp. cibarius]QKD68891.1 protein tyrosine phosphatase [Proteus terrae subsp. cibarius]QKD74065.1 protein tyrosine phosphatase [Proteus terrae subsp. cibarius]UDF24823.1 dual specificity protein phosphatase family protein [Proteus terrae subsp. cibarius]